MLRPTIAVFLAFLALYFATAGGHLYSPDEEIMFRTTESLAARGSLAIEPIRGPDGKTFASARGLDGREYAQYGVANSLFAVPLWWAGDVACRFVSDDAARRALDFRTTGYVDEGPGRGHALLRRFAVSFFGAFVAAATVALLWRLVARLFDAGDGRRASRPAWLAAAAYGAGTIALPHARTYFSEPLATFFVLLAFYWGWGAGPLTPRQALACGAAAALALLARLDSIFVMPAVALFLALRFVEGREGGLRAAAQLPAGRVLRGFATPGFVGRAALFAAPIAVFFAFQLAMNRLHFGSFTKSAYADQSEGIHFSTPLLAGLYGFLFSVGKSVFLFSPAVVLMLAGMRGFVRRFPAIGWSLAAAALLGLLVHARWQNWAGGWCWGPRHIFMAHALLAPFAAALAFDWSRARASLVAAVLVPAFAVQLYGASQSFIDFYILYYRTPDRGPNAYVMFSGEDAAPAQVIAPINDSVYVPQNSQWQRYAEMWKLGFRDNLWLRLSRRAAGAEQEVR